MFQLIALANRMKPFITARMDERGATAVEYGLIIALIAGIIIVMVGALGQDILGAFDGVENEIDGVNDETP